MDQPQEARPRIHATPLCKTHCRVQTRGETIQQGCAPDIKPKLQVKLWVSDSATHSIHLLQLMEILSHFDFESKVNLRNDASPWEREKTLRLPSTPPWLSPTSWNHLPFSHHVCYWHWSKGQFPGDTEAIGEKGKKQTHTKRVWTLFVCVCLLFSFLSHWDSFLSHWPWGLVTSESVTSMIQLKSQKPEFDSRASPYNAIFQITCSLAGPACLASILPSASTMCYPRSWKTTCSSLLPT